MPRACPSYEQLAQLVVEQAAAIGRLEARIVELGDEVSAAARAELSGLVEAAVV